MPSAGEYLLPRRDAVLSPVCGEGTASFLASSATISFVDGRKTLRLRSSARTSRTIRSSSTVSLRLCPFLRPLGDLSGAGVRGPYFAVEYLRIFSDSDVSSSPLSAASARLCASICSPSLGLAIVKNSVTQVRTAPAASSEVLSWMKNSIRARICCCCCVPRPS